ncbi:hypothetical protein F5887DRAFT_922104 [Amanita rubescens]|nr:hypothetical protein F5887DRAFT_922104 [Amanita rubescens]
MSFASNLILGFKGDLVRPGDPGYDDALKRWAANASRKASVVAFVKDEEDVALAIKYARDSGLPIAIRGGGHSAAGGSSIENGLVVDLSRYLNGVTIDAEKQLAHVGGGAIWETVDKAAIEHGLASVGGTVNHTGVGGLTLGGGFGWLTGSHGLVIDNLVEATVVIADSSVVTASETENPELFFGIRGGGSNFGVVTRFAIRLHPQRRLVYAGSLKYPPPLFESVFNVLKDWWPTKTNEKEGLTAIHTNGPNGQPMLVCFVFYNGSAEEGRRNFKALLDLRPVSDTTGEIPYERVNGLQNEFVGYGKGYYTKSAGHEAPDFAISNRVLAKLAEMKLKDINCTIVFEYFPPSTIKAIPNGTMAFNRTCRATAVIMLQWDNTIGDHSQRAREVAYEIAISILYDGPYRTKFVAG